MDKSWYPILMSSSIYNTLICLFMYISNKNFFFIGIFFFLIMNFLWYRDLIRESFLIGKQNFLVLMSIKMGMIIMILSEIFFFVSFFWAFFHFMFMYSGEMGFKWPAVNISSVNYLSVPMFNTLILLSSGLSLTLAHFLMLLNMNSMKKYLLMTIILGVVFSCCQFWEYLMLEFLWSDSSFGSIFYMGTGFHGIHVLIGSILLISVLIRSMFYKINHMNNMFELASWYWHFVDVVWIFLFTEFYWFSY